MWHGSSAGGCQTLPVDKHACRSYAKPSRKCSIYNTIEHQPHCQIVQMKGGMLDFQLRCDRFRLTTLKLTKIRWDACFACYDRHRCEHLFRLGILQGICRLVPASSFKIHAWHIGTILAWTVNALGIWFLGNLSEDLQLVQFQALILTANLFDRCEITLRIEELGDVNHLRTSHLVHKGGKSVETIHFLKSNNSSHYPQKKNATVRHVKKPSFLWYGIFSGFFLRFFRVFLLSMASFVHHWIVISSDFHGFHSPGPRITSLWNIQRIINPIIQLLISLLRLRWSRNQSRKQQHTSLLKQ